MEKLKLKKVGRYKDGGSLGLVDEDGNEYWQCFKFGDKEADNYGKLFKGNINDKPRSEPLNIEFEIIK